MRLTFIAIALCLLFPMSAFGQDAETFNAAMDEGDFASALDSADRWYAATKSYEALQAQVSILRRVGRQDDAQALIDAHPGLTDSQRSELAKVGDTTPEYVPIPNKQPDTVSQPKDDATLGWVLVGGGAFTALGAGIGLFIANVEATKIACSPRSNAPKDGCSDDGYGQLTRSEFTEKTDNVSTIRFASFVMAGLAAALTGWGLYTILNAKSDGPSVSIAPHANGIDLSIDIAF